MNGYWLRRGIALILPFIFVFLVATSAGAAVGSTTYVIVGGAQSPAKSYTFTWWATGSAYGCNTPYSKVDVYIRWYLDSVQRTRVFLDHVYIKVRPTRSAFWDHVELVGGGNHVASRAILVNIPANTYTSRTFQYDRWVTTPLLHANVILMNNQGNEYTGCSGEGYASDYLRVRT
jgi:hypothetical protein